MQTIGKPITPPRHTPNCAIASFLLHLILLAVFVHQSASWVAPIRLPGSPRGTNVLLTYSPGKAPMQTFAPNPKTQPKRAESTTPLPTPPVEKKQETTASPNTNSPASTQPDSTAGADSLGSGSINI